MKRYDVTALRWDHGWELHVGGVGVTQVDRLEDAEQQVRDLIESLDELGASGDDVDVRIEVGDEETTAPR
jgi:hypothetical protein